jgi:hypothetical protein
VRTIYDTCFTYCNVTYTQGDFMQLPPVTMASHPLYSDKAKTAQQGCAGRLLWKLVTSCTILTKSERSMCPILNDMLYAIRTGTTTPEQHKIMMQRVLAFLPTQERSRFLLKATVITPTQICKQRVSIAHDTANKQGSRQLIAMSRDIPTITK